MVVPELGTLLRWQTPCVTFDGGYAEYMVAPQEALAKIPDELGAAEAASLLCAGITTLNALRNSGAGPGDVVTVHGIGGLGHLGLQFARLLSFTAIAIGRGGDWQALAIQFGSHRYLDSDSENPTQAFASLGGAKVILATAPSGKAMAMFVDGPVFDGRLLLTAVSSERMEVTSLQLLSGHSITGLPSGTSIVSGDTLRFAATTGVRPMIETFPLAPVNRAYDQMMSGRGRLRAVLTMETHS